MIKVLILEDEIYRQEEFKKRCIENGIDFDIAASSVDAINYLNEEYYDIIFLDHDLGGADTGAIVARYILSNHIKSKVIIHSMNPVGSAAMHLILTDSICFPMVWMRENFSRLKINQN